MKPKTIQDLVDKFVAIEKRVVQIEIAEILFAITENNCLEPEDAIGQVRHFAESLKEEDK